MDTFPLYGPVQGDMPQVEENLREITKVEFSWMALLLEHVLSQRGKLLRPAITLLAGKSYNYDLKLLIPMASATELLHTATLVHDDTIDNAQVRRGNPTINTLWDGNTAVLLGDYLFANSAEMVSRTQNVRVMRLFALTLMTILRGEMSQDFAGYDWGQSREAYFQRIGNKTAALFSMASESGALLSGAPERAVQALKEYGYNLGTAFQIADDILDFTGESDEMGKPVGSDLSQGTLTLPSILLMEYYPDENPILSLFQEKGNPGYLKKAVEMINNSHIIQDSYSVAERFSAEAQAALEPLPSGPARRTLEELTHYILERRS